MRPPPISPKVFNSRTEGRRAPKVISVSHNLRSLNTPDPAPSLYDPLLPRHSKTNVCFGCISRTVGRREMKPPRARPATPPQGRRITPPKLYDPPFQRYGVKCVFPYTMNGTGVSENFSKCQNQFLLFYSVKGCQEHVSGHYESIGTFFLVHF